MKQKDPGAVLEGDRLDSIIKAARYMAQTLVRQLELPSAEVDDVSQELVAAVIARRHYFDPARARWFTFYTMVLRQAAFDIIQSYQSQFVLAYSLDEPCEYEGEALSRCDLIAEAEGLPALWNGAPDPFMQAELAIDVARFLADLNGPLRSVALTLLHHAPGTARRRAGLSQTGYHRVIHDLRMQMLMAGLAEADAVAPDPAEIAPL